MSKGISPWIGWGISTLLLLWMNRKNKNKGDTTNQQPSKFTEHTGSQIGNCIPVVLGRVMIKNPLISYYGDYSWKQYTEEYGMHSKLNVVSLIWPILLGIIAYLVTPSKHAVFTNTGGGTALDVENGAKKAIMISTIISALTALLMWLFNRHAGRVTIQKGFKYYLGWQHILCWTGDNFGLKRIWMNVYDTNVEQSTVTGVWQPQNIAWKSDNLTGLVARIDDEEMFGGVDEGGGFTGSLHFYFGTDVQPFDAWMVEQMYQSSNVPTNLKGLTPKYPMFVTCVINDTSDYSSQPTPTPTPTPQDPLKIVVLGDSVSSGYPYTSNKPSVSDDIYSWTHYFRNLSGFDVINSAIAGDNSAQMLARFQADVLAYQPDYLILETGGNDYPNFGANYLQQTKDNIDAMLSLCAANNIKVIFLCCTIPTNMPLNSGGFPHNAQERTEWRDYLNDVMFHEVSSGASSRAAILYYEAIWSSYNTIDYSYMYDAGHPNMAGYEKIGNFIYEKLQYLDDRTVNPVVPVAPVKANEVAGGAYIGKQSTVPEMWFEVVNYPSTLKDNYVSDLERLFINKVNYLNDIVKQTANVEGIPSGATQEYNDLQNEINSLNVSNLNPARLAALNLLNVLSSDLELYRRVEKLYNLLVHGVWILGRIGDDCNPAEVIYEILINSDWGCNYDANIDVIDMDSLLMLGATCEEEGLGISCFINNTAQAYVYIDKILNHINAVKYDSNVTGKLTFKMIRNDYEVQKLKIFNPSNCESLDFTRIDWSETASSVSVNFTLAENKYIEAQLVVSDVANPLITNLYNEFNIDGTYFTEPKNARIMAQTQLLSAAYPLSAVNFVCNRYGYDLNIGEPIVVNWDFYGISKQIFRVTDIDYGTLTDGKITITAMEDVFGFDQTDYSFSPSPVWTDPEEDPEDISNYLFFEYPYEMAKDLNTYVYAYAAQPSIETIQWYVWRRLGANYSMRSTSNKWSMMGRMRYGYDEAYDDNDTIGFEIVDVPNNSVKDLDDKIALINSNPYMYTNKSGLNLLECNGEIMSYSGIDLLPNGNYRVYGVVRGVYDTVPKKHLAYDVIHFLDYGLNVNLSSYVCASGFTSQESLELTTSSQTKAQTFDINKTVNFETVRRTESPSIMGNLKFGADRGTFTTLDYNFPAGTAFCHDIIFTFKARDKFNDSLIKGQGDASITVPTTQKNVIYFKSNSNDYEIMYDAYDINMNPPTLESFTFKWAEFCQKMGQRVRDNNTVYLEVKTYDPVKNLYSYDHYEKQIIMLPPILVGVVASVNDVQTFADSIVYDNTVMQIPTVPTVCSGFSLDYERAALIFIGTQNTNGDFLSLDGNLYDISSIAYRIDGATETPPNSGNYVASVHQVNIDDYYIFRTNYTGLNANPDYYQKLPNIGFVKYSIYP